ncbi:MAG: secondary thiamine-phosphate synthase enzyme YjbQ [Coriobacteriia bacterium]|nr:secondary thiamine-phosphate synthase enzyme YjbQ [Coriobacteriia bacterium]
MQRLHISTTVREQLVDITLEVAEAVAVSGIAEGVAVVYSPHTTAGITVNENADPDVAADLLETLRRIVPCEAGYRHCEGNSDAHVKASLVGSSAVVPIDGGRLVLGTWQGVYFAEFDGPRSRNVIVTVTPG